MKRLSLVVASVLVMLSGCLLAGCDKETLALHFNETVTAYPRLDSKTVDISAGREFAIEDYGETFNILIKENVYSAVSENPWRVEDCGDDSLIASYEYLFSFGDDVYFFNRKPSE